MVLKAKWNYITITQTIQSALVINDLDFLGLTETWIKEDDLTTPNHLCPSGYKIKTIFRRSRIDGGIVIIHCEDLEIKTNKTYDFNMMESTDFKIIQMRSKDKSIHLVVIYRPPDSSTIQFANELADFMEENINNMGHLLLIGDINTKINVEIVPGTMLFNDFLDSFKLANTVNFPTHHQDNKLERSGRKDPDVTNKLIDFYRKCREVDNMMDRSERSYYLSSLHDNRFNTKKIYVVCDDLLDRSKELPLPQAESNQKLANRFNQFFTKKIQKIRNNRMEFANDDSFTPLEVMDDNILNYIYQAGGCPSCKSPGSH